MKISKICVSSIAATFLLASFNFDTSKTFAVKTATLRSNSSVQTANVYVANKIPKNIQNRIEKMVNERSYFEGVDGMVRKPREERVMDLIKWYKKHGNLNPYDNFNALGLDIKNFRNQDDFMPWDQLCHERRLPHHNNKLNPKNISYGNKLEFYKTVSSINKNYTPIVRLALYNEKVTYYNISDNSKKVDQKNIPTPHNAILSLPNGKYACKLIHGLQGRGFYVLEKNNKTVKITNVNGKVLSIDEFLNSIKSTPYLIQDWIKQHKDIEKFCPQTVNTIRLVTVRYNNEAQILGATLSHGGANSITDHTHQGGMCISIDIDTGKLKKYGCPHYNTVSLVHPVTKEPYEGRQIPYFKEAVNLVKKLHNTVFIFKNLSSIGFDVAITPTGPKVVEANSYWGSGILQVPGGGFRQRWEALKNK